LLETLLGDVRRHRRQRRHLPGRKASSSLDSTGYDDTSYDDPYLDDDYATP
jgi:hypothetical protein